MFASLQYRGNKFMNLRIQKRFSPRYGDDRCRTFIHRLQALFQAHHLLNSVGVFADSATAGTGQIAEVSRLQHQYQRILFCLVNLVADNVFCQIIVETEWKTH